MLMAVSFLSPVRTQTLIPALWRASMVSGTSSCSLSTIPVVPEHTQIQGQSTLSTTVPKYEWPMCQLQWAALLPSSVRLVSSLWAESSSSSSLFSMLLSASSCLFSHTSYSSSFRTCSRHRTHSYSVINTSSYIPRWIHFWADTSPSLERVELILKAVNGTEYVSGHSFKYL